MADVFLRRDLANVLLAAYQAHNSTASAIGDDSERSQGYRNGYRDAIATVALFVGIAPALCLPEEAPRPSRRADVKVTVSGDTALATRERRG